VRRDLRLADGGDLLVVWLFRGVDLLALVLDHPSRARSIVQLTHAA
jgi:hypothetical protein